MIEISISNLVKQFQGNVVLNDINLQIGAGELFFLLGPSGCGKTTLLRTIAGFYSVDSGKIFFGEKEVTKLPPHKRKTGMVFQSYALWPHMTVEQNVAFGLQQKKAKKSEIIGKVGEALENVQMLPYASRKPNELSGGQQQRVALARALVVRPRCLLLDEPLSNLDAQLRNEMRIEIRRISKAYHLTSIYVTHDQKEALSIADRIAVIEKGKIRQIASPLEVYKRPNSCFVANFIGETNIIDGVVIRRGADEAFVRTKIGNFRGMIDGKDDKIRTGNGVKVLIRPESIKLESLPTEENCVEGMIGHSTYFGEVAHYLFEKNGIQLRISELNPCHLTQTERYGIYAWVLPEDVVILSE
ncbi:MAG: ABC transporter ATP-binding protein [Puniceicoccales bacterium]|jgi:iron(III) transport system ATP-binding protein|nr:ABC transporter ATP-binding protein [Puniceicoccales bacterium]